MQDQGRSEQTVQGQWLRHGLIVLPRLHKVLGDIEDILVLVGRHGTDGARVLVLVFELQAARKRGASRERSILAFETVGGAGPIWSGASMALSGRVAWHRCLVILVAANH